jgi:hypothetical protein
MAAKPISDELWKAIWEYGQRVPRLTNRKIADLLHTHPTTVLNYRKKPFVSREQREEKLAETSPEVDETNGDFRSVTLPRTRISTLDELIEHCRIDTEIWQIDRFICNKWEVGIKKGEGEGARVEVEPLFQVKAFMRRRAGVDETKRIIDRLWERAKNYAPHYPEILIRSGEAENVAEYAIVDIHLGQLIWGKETLGKDWDLEISIRGFKRAVLELEARLESFRPGKALIVLGNDQQNTDNSANTTTAGTPQHNDSRYQKVFDASADCSTWMIDELLQRYGAVDVVIVPGNHDTLAAWHLGRLLQTHYRKVSAVQIDNTPTYRKYWEFGVNMLMLTHGNKGKLEAYDKTMAAERPSMWGRTRWREAHTGDKHHRRTIELPGATVRILPSLRPACAWSSENHFVGTISAAESFMWNRSEGLIGSAIHSVLDMRIE